MKSHKTSKSRTLSFQPLEDRSLMAGNVTAAVQNGVLTITGDNKANDIKVFQIGTNSYQIMSVDGATKINGKTAKSFNGVTGDVIINLKGGDDFLVVGQERDLFGVEAPTQFSNVPRNLMVDLGDGNNSFTLNGVTVQGKMSLTAGAGNDTAFFGYSHIGYSNVNAGANDCNINLGVGANEIDMYFTVVERDLLLNEGASSRDNIFLEGGWTGRNLNIQTGSGNDFVNLDRMNILNQLSIATGNGNDKVILGGYDADNADLTDTPGEVSAAYVNLDLGAGNDTLQVGGNHDNHSVGGLVENYGSFNGGTGQDRYMNYSGQNFFGGFSGFDFFAQIVAEKGLNQAHTYSPGY